MTWQAGESGNLEGSKRQKKFLAALNRALDSEDGKRLRAAAEKLLDLAASGEAWAIKELADRLDGKAHQQIIATDDEGRSIAIAVIAYHHTPQLPAAAVSTPDTQRLGFRQEESGSSLAS